MTALRHEPVRLIITWTRHGSVSAAEQTRRMDLEHLERCVAGMRQLDPELVDRLLNECESNSSLPVRSSEGAGPRGYVGASVSRAGRSDVAMCHVLSPFFPSVGGSEFPPRFGATLERLASVDEHDLGDLHRNDERVAGRSSVADPRPHPDTRRVLRNQFREGGENGMGMTSRVTVPAVEETADVGAVIAEFVRSWRQMVADGIQRHEHERIESFLQRLQRKHREAARAVTEADIHMEMIAGWTRVNGPNEKTVRMLKQEGYEIDGRHQKERAA